jgi:hypothetical protein
MNKPKKRPRPKQPPEKLVPDHSQTVCPYCGRTNHPLADNGLCWECWTSEQDKIRISQYLVYVKQTLILHRKKFYAISRQRGGQLFAAR